MNIYKDKPDILKKVKWTSVRVRDSKTHRMVVQQVTQIYDREDGERIFEDIEGEEVGSTQVLDDNRFQLTDD